MSKRNRADDPGDERLDPDFGSPEPFESFEEADRTQRSRMARELKIGLAAIFALVIVLAIVLYNRLSQGKESPGASAEAESEALQEAPNFEAATPEPESSPATWAPPTIIPAIAGPEEPPQGASAPGFDSWGSAGGAGQFAEKSRVEAVPLSPPSLAPRLVSVAPADRYAGYRGAEQAGAPAGRVVSGAGVETGGFAEADDLEQGGSTASDSGDAEVPSAGASHSRGLPLPSAQLDRARPPAFSEAGNSLLPSTREPDPLRRLTGAAGPAGETGTVLSPEATSLSDPPPQAFQGDARQAPMPVAEAGLSRPGWSAGAAAVPSDPTRPTLVTRDSAPAGLGSRDAAGAAVQDGKYVVQPNDNYWAISEKVYGTGAYFKALAYHNRARIPNEHRLDVGETVMTPDASELYRAYPDLCPKPAHREAAERRSLAGARQPSMGAGRVYVVQEGDNLFDIARCELGKATRWTEIVDLNRQVVGTRLEDLNYLTPGMKLLLPQDQPAGELSRRPDSPYPR